ncbi:MAG: RluA family pseudouridine synthase, partial [Proteobacteria bacterium]|nr:RluA family pseudouridine synthase [Pseudomonadota bacterium]
EIARIADPAVKAAVEARLAELGGDPKKFADPANHPWLESRDGRRTPIHKVRVRVNAQTLTLAPDSPRERNVITGSNHHLEITEVTDKKGRPKWEGALVSRFEALRRLRPTERLELVHRLDRDTSGCLMVAKSREVLLELHQALRDRTVRKRYAVLVFGTWPKRLRTIRLPLHRYVVASGERRVRVASAGKPSRTDVQVVAQREQATWINAHLFTGRTHQIRVHTFASGHGVVGDDKYGLPENRKLAEQLKIRRLCLHAEQIILPFRNTTLRFECPIPIDFQSAWDSFGAHRS